MPNLNEIFEPHSGYGELVDEFLYGHRPVPPDDGIIVLSGSTIDSTLMGRMSSDTKQLPSGEAVKVFAEPSILVTRNGFYAGTVKFISEKQYTINDHAYLLLPREEWRGRIILEWFAYVHRNIFKPFITSRNANATFALDFLSKINIEVPDVKEQSRIVQKMLQIEKQLERVSSLRTEIHTVVNTKIALQTGTSSSPIDELFDVHSGNHGLTEQVIYDQPPRDSKDSVPIYSGSSDNESPLGHIKNGAVNNKGEPLDYFDGESIILTKDGSSGELTYKNGERFTLNHHACVLRLKDHWKNQLLVEWIASQYKHDLLQYVTSRSDNRVLSSEWFERVKFAFPDIDAQKRQLNKISALRTMDARLNAIQNECEKLLNYSVIATKIAEPISVTEF